MNWVDHVSYIEIIPPVEFNFGECLVFLGRSDQEVLHQMKDGYLYKLVKMNQELLLLKIWSTTHSILVEFLDGHPSKRSRDEVATYIWEWFDLNSNLNSFYAMAQHDKILSPLTQKYDGLRIIGIPDLFEALTWAIIGQQINLTFAYTLKGRFVKKYGEKLDYDGQTFWLYPDFQAIANIDIEDLKGLQFTTRKAEYVIDIAKSMTRGDLSKENLRKQQDFLQIHKSLVSIRGVGAWTADYVMMKCLHQNSAFPIADVGLHNALKIQLGLEQKPSIEEIKEIAKNWEGWQAYATFYLWRSLYV